MWAWGIVVLFLLLSEQARGFALGGRASLFPVNALAGSSTSSSTRLHLFGSPEPPKNNAPAKQGGGGLFGGGGGGMMDKMKQAQDLMKKAEEINKELVDTVIMGQDKDGLVFATFNGMGVPVGIKVSDAGLAMGSEAVSLAATQAVIEAHAKAQSVMMQRMSQMYGGMGLPGMPK